VGENLEGALLARALHRERHGRAGRVDTPHPRQQLRLARPPVVHLKPGNRLIRMNLNPYSLIVIRRRLISPPNKFG
jgi:hypothetical protein